MVKPTTKRTSNKKTVPNESCEVDDHRPTKSERETKKGSIKKQSNPQRESSDDDDSMIDEGTRPSKMRKTQASSNADTFIDLSPKTPKFASLPTFSCFIGELLFLSYKLK